ncbi:hypothetical protein [Sinorhizobium sp. GL28]|uniref:hypothetical protein n=1 Tax=Sinorhizobium sp. GL28 TaxID=1358418 RepID=UPI0013B034BA|nr:hypothetical protein [Sinorhizobium sp. GL28]
MSLSVGPIGDFSDLLEHAVDAAGRRISRLEPALGPCDLLFNAAAIDLGGGGDVH